MEGVHDFVSVYLRFQCGRTSVFEVVLMRWYMKNQRTDSFQASWSSQPSGNHPDHPKLIVTGCGTTPVGCRGGSRYVEGCWAFPHLKIKQVFWFLGFLRFMDFRISKICQDSTIVGSLIFSCIPQCGRTSVFEVVLILLSASMCKPRISHGWSGWSSSCVGCLGWSF